MIFQISDNIRLAGTPREWQLQKLKNTKKDGQPTVEWRAFKFYRNFDHAIDAMAQYDFRMADDWPDFSRRLARLREVAESVTRQVSEAVVP